MKERIKNINMTAWENFDKAEGMLEMFNEIYGTNYGFLNKRVVMFEGDKKDYAKCKDAWVNL